jgi:hypothetical protein
MRRNIAPGALFHRPPLDDIPAVGVPFPEFFRKENDVDYR